MEDEVFHAYKKVDKMEQRNVAGALDWLKELKNIPVTLELQSMRIRIRSYTFSTVSSSPGKSVQRAINRKTLKRGKKTLAASQDSPEAGE